LLIFSSKVSLFCLLADSASRQKSLPALNARLLSASAKPRQLLRAIPHVELLEAVEAGVCCGSAGIYNLVQPAEAAELGRIKAADLSGTGADLAVSANIGCSLQIREHLAGTPRPIPVAHPMELLARAAATPGTAEGMAPA
jgi:glycolate oxidase iron-sulfur subunit